MNNCIICFGDIQRGITLYDYVFRKDCICGVCRKKFKRLYRSIQVGELSIFSLYAYDDYLEDLLFTYKENRDIALAPIFIYPFLKELHKKYRGYTVVFAPSSVEKTKDRGFHSLRKLFDSLRLDKKELFTKNSNYKQSDQSYDNRINVKNVIVRNQEAIPNTPILLVDDVCTSGNTLKVMKELLANHIHPIACLTISIHQELIK